MYRNYEEYQKIMGEMIRQNNMEGKIKLRTLEEFLRDNYRDKVEWYLMEEWGTEPFHEIFYAGCEPPEDESDEISPEEERADELHGVVYEIIMGGMKLGMSVNQTARKVYEYLSKEKAI